MKILFVDDETNVLDGLRRAFRGRRNEWQMTFVASGQEALAHLEQETVDVVVSDMKMPNMDGATLLGEIKERSPGSIRLILSGHAEKELVLRSIGAAHQYLSKPCEPELLGRTIDRAIALRQVFSDEALLAIVSDVESLPTLPAVFREIVAKLQEPDCSLHEVGEIIAKDIGMSARLLQLVNSSFFGLRRPVSDVGQAAAYLGLDVINSLVLGAGAVSCYDGVTLGGITVDQIWKQSMQTSGLIRALTDGEGIDSGVRDDARTGGVLMDAGRLILAAEFPERYAGVCASVKAGAGTLCEIEREILGTTHAQVGAYLIGRWGLPDSVIEAVAFHEEPDSCPCQELSATTYVHVASRLSSASSAVAGGEDGIHMEYLQRIGAADRLESWRTTARELNEEKVGS